MIQLFLVFVAIGVADAAYSTGDPDLNITESQPASVFQTLTRRTGLLHVVSGEDVTMSCTVTNLPQSDKVIWQKIVIDSDGKEQTTPVSKDSDPSDNILYSIEKPRPFTWRLRVKGITAKSEGKFMCSLWIDNKNKVSSNRTVIVQEPAMIDYSRTSTDMVVLEGDTVDLNCFALGIPEPVVEWTRVGNQPLPIGRETFRGNKITIPRVKPGDRGLYVCNAYNTLGNNENSISTDQRQIKLDVIYKPIIDVPVPIVRQKKGYRIELQCFVAANPVPEIDQLGWMKNNEFIEDSDRLNSRALKGAFGKLTYELIIAEVLADDYGTYNCKVSNTEGSSMASVELEESDTPYKSVKLGRIISASSTIVHSILVLFVCTLVLITL